MHILPSDIWPIFDATPVELLPQDNSVIDRARNSWWPWRKPLMYKEENKVEQKPLSTTMDTSSPS
jgi:hypothetical protein